MLYFSLQRKMEKKILEEKFFFEKSICLLLIEKLQKGKIKYQKYERNSETSR